MNVAVPASQMTTAMTEDMLILVDERNRATGTCGKLETHRRGLLHRAFSIFLFDGEGRILLQRRAVVKYHSGGLWANTCCGHPRFGERTDAAAKRRLHEELGMQAGLRYGFRARYRTPLDHGLTENELVYVYGGRIADMARPNPEEVSETRVVALDALIADVARRPEGYVYWLRHYLDRHADDLAAMAEACRTP